MSHVDFIKMSHSPCIIYLGRKEVFFIKKDKTKALELLKQKINGEIIITYKEIANQTGYERKQINRFLSEIEKKDIDSILVHGLINKPSIFSIQQRN